MTTEADDQIGDVLPSADMLDRMGEMISASGRMVAFTGAGISTESGIPDYRGPHGAWQTGNIPHIDSMRTDDEARKVFWRQRLETYPIMLGRLPNAGHEALVQFERAGKLLAVITQNIDGLHQLAGNTPGRVIELHGSSHRLRCTECRAEYDGVTIQARLEEGADDPRCVTCGGPLRSSTVLFGEALPENALQLAQGVSLAADLMLVVGSSLVVNPAAKLPQIAKQKGAGLIIINRTPTALDDLADIRVAAEAGPTLAELARRVLGGDAAKVSRQQYNNGH